MNWELKSHRLRLPALFFLAAVLALGLVVGCGDDDENPANPGGSAPTTSAFTGWLANPVENGSLAITVNTGNLAGRIGAPNAPRHAAAASGTLTLDGSGPIPLTGTFDDEALTNLTVTDTLGLGYTLSGLYDPGPPSNIFGTYTGPNGNGSFDCFTGGSSSATIMCGTWVADDLLDSGSFTFSIRGSAIEGVVFAPGSLTQITFTGTVSGTGTTRPVAISTLLPGLYQLTAGGTLDTSTNTVTDGTYDFVDIAGGGANDGTGTWTSGLCD